MENTSNQWTKVRKDGTGKRRQCTSPISGDRNTRETGTEYICKLIRQTLGGMPA